MQALIVLFFAMAAAKIVGGGGDMHYTVRLTPEQQAAEREAVAAERARAAAEAAEECKRSCSKSTERGVSAAKSKQARAVRWPYDDAAAKISVTSCWRLREHFGVGLSAR